MILTHSSISGLRPLAELTSCCADAALFNLPDYCVLERKILGFGPRRIHVESTVVSRSTDRGVIVIATWTPTTVVPHIKMLDRGDGPG
jgi:hypothetical protein